MYFLRCNENGRVILIENEPTEEQLQAYTLISNEQYQDYLRILDLKKNLADTDYRAIKFVEGALSQQEYEPIRVQRQEWRDEINRLELSLQSENN